MPVQEATPVASLAATTTETTVSSELYKKTIEDIIGKSKQKELEENRKALKAIPKL